MAPTSATTPTTIVVWTSTRSTTRSNGVMVEATNAKGTTTVTPSATTPGEFGRPTSQCVSTITVAAVVGDHDSPAHPLQAGPVERAGDAAALHEGDHRDDRGEPGHDDVGPHRHLRRVADREAEPQRRDDRCHRHQHPSAGREAPVGKRQRQQDDDPGHQCDRERTQPGGAGVRARLIGRPGGEGGSHHDRDQREVESQPRHPARHDDGAQRPCGDDRGADPPAGRGALDRAQDGQTDRTGRQQRRDERDRTDRHPGRPLVEVDNGFRG